MNKFVKLLPAMMLSLSVVPAHGQDAFVKATISTQKLSESVYMLTGMGGNIGVSAGKDGILIIDDQFAPLADKIVAALGDISNKPIKYLVNTHYHGDHTGGNAYFSEQQHSTIFAHHNVRSRLESDDKNPPSALPVVTYEQGLTFHFNDETIKVMHLPAGHTDSDSVIWFQSANVLHVGDLFFESRFPYIDLQGGGTVAGYIKNVQSLLTMMNADTQIIPGHGKLAKRADYQKVLNMLLETSAYVAQKKKQGVSLADLLKTGLDPKWQSWSWEFINEAKWITTLYEGQ